MVDPGDIRFATDGEKFTIVVILAVSGRSIDVAVITYRNKTDDVVIKVPAGLPGEEALRRTFLDDERSREVFARDLAETRVRTIAQLVGKVVTRVDLLTHLGDHVRTLK